MNGSSIMFTQEITAENLAKGKLPIPRDYEWKSTILSNKRVLRDEYNNMWLVELEKDGSQWYFGYGWMAFASDNKLVPGDNVHFYPKGSSIFAVTIVGSNKCQKKGVGGPKIAIVKDEEEEIPDQVNNGIEVFGEAEEEMEMPDQVNGGIQNVVERDAEDEEEMEVNHNEETSNQTSEEIGYCGERLDDTSEEEELVPVSRKSKAKFQPKLKACRASSSRAAAAPVGLPINQPRRSSRSCVEKTSAAITKSLQEDKQNHSRTGKKRTK